MRQNQASFGDEKMPWNKESEKKQREDEEGKVQEPRDKLKPTPGYRLTVWSCLVTAVGGEGEERGGLWAS